MRTWEGPLVYGAILTTFGKKAKLETVHCCRSLFSFWPFADEETWAPDYLSLTLPNTHIFQLQISLFLAVKRPTQPLRWIHELMRIWGCEKYQGGQWWAGADAEAKQPSHNKCSWSFPRPISWPRSRPRLRSSLIKTKWSAQFHVIAEGTLGFNVTLLKLSFMKWLSLFYQTLNFTSMLQGPKNNCQN